MPVIHRRHIDISGCIVTVSHWEMPECDGDLYVPYYIDSLEGHSTEKIKNLYEYLVDVGLIIKATNNLRLFRATLRDLGRYKGHVVPYLFAFPVKKGDGEAYKTIENILVDRLTLGAPVNCSITGCGRILKFSY